MIPFGNEVVTLISRDEYKDENGRRHARYSAARLTGCSWKRVARAYLTGDGVKAYQEETVCRVPYGQPAPKAGDLLIRGEAYERVESAAQFEKLLERYRDGGGAFTVAAVSDNTRPGLPLRHYAARS